MLENLGQNIGHYSSDAIPFWIEWGMSLPFLKKRLQKQAVSKLVVYEHGIQIEHLNSSRKPLVLPYQAICRVWFERFQTGSEHAGHTSFRIDIIDESLDTLFRLVRTDCNEDDPVMLLMEGLYQAWKQHVWKHHHVVCAIVTLSAKDAGRSDIADPATPVYLCMQKGVTRYDYTSYKWEFPGGKVEGDESEVDALKRELMEEMDYTIEVRRHLCTIDHRYRDFGITLSCYLCTANSADFVRKEHNDHKWLTIGEMQQLDWCAADAPVLQALKDTSDTGD